MKKTIILGVAVIASFLPVSASVIIDDFNDSATLTALPDSSSTTLGASAVGGSRFQSLTKNDADGTADNLKINAALSPGILDFNNANGSSTAYILWDGRVADASSTDQLGLGNFDLWEGGVDTILRLGVGSDLGKVAGITIRITKSAGVYAETTVNLPPTVDPNPPNDILIVPLDIPYSSFSAFGGFNLAADFGSVNSISLTLNGRPALDAKIDFISSTTTDAPEPATFAIFGAGLAALGLLRRRAKKS